MNLLRLKRKNKKKIGIKRFLLVICSMIMSSFAWFAFSKVLNTSFSGHMVSWDIVFKKDGGVITNTESIDFSFSNLYPGVTDKITVDVENNGESTAEIVYVIKSITFLGKTYSIKNPGSAKDNNSIVLETAYSSGSNVTQTILNTNTKINNEYLLENATENIIEEENYIRTPFTISANSSPPLLKHIPIGEKCSFNIFANIFIISSPLECPYVSLIILKPLRSIITIIHFSSLFPSDITKKHFWFSNFVIPSTACFILP